MRIQIIQTRMSNIKDYIENNKQRFIDELLDLLKIPSVSADSKFNDDMLKAADFVKQKLIDAGAENVEVCPTAGHPIVYGEKLIDEKPTNNFGIWTL